MRRLVRWARRFIREEDGLELVEYAVMGALIAALLVTALVALSGSIETEFGRLKGVIDSNPAGG